VALKVREFEGGLDGAFPRQSIGGIWKGVIAGIGAQAGRFRQQAADGRTRRSHRFVDDGMRHHIGRRQGAFQGIDAIFLRRNRQGLCRACNPDHGIGALIVCFREPVRKHGSMTKIVIDRVAS
jgi:hypothetical protein